MNYLIFIFFLVSGMCGLIYEVVWSREFSLVLGGTTHAVTAVVASFMGGLALGSFVGGRLVDRTRRDPVLIYGLLEGGIGALALLVPVFVKFSQPLVAYLYQHLSGSPGLYGLLRLLVTAAILVPPTALMGATLPILVKGTLQGRERFGFTAGRLYAVNTTGAVAGAALAGFVLLPALGGRLTVILAAGLNLAICAVILLLRRRLPTAPAAAAPGDAPTETSVPVVMLVGYGLSGLAALIYQIAWTRSLALTLGGSTYTFSLILTAYIGGLALGGAAITPWVDRVRRPRLSAGLMEFAIAVAALAVLPFLDNVNLAMYRWYYEYQWTGPWLPVVRFGVAFGAVVVPTALMGALLPLVARVVAGDRAGAGEAMGWVYSANTVGAIVGAFLAGYVLLDRFGVRTTVLGATGVSLGIGALWIWRSELPARTAALAAAAALLGGSAAIRFMPPADPLVLNSGPYMYAQRVMAAAGPEVDLRAHLNRLYLNRYYREDAETSVLVLEERIEQWRSLRINGKVDASSEADMPNQILLAQLPLLLHPHPRTVMVLGLASGVTAGSALLHPIESLDCLELSPAVVEASRYFDFVNRLDRADPRYHLLIADGRNHLTLGDRRYDVIISEPSNPWQAAMSAMFTAEFFTLMRDHLNDGGIAVAWIDVYDMDLETFRLIVRTFTSVFPQAAMWESEFGADYILTGSNAPLDLDYGRIAARCREPRVRDELRRIQDHAEEDILARLVMAGPALERVAGPGPVHTDDRRQLEFQMPRLAFSPYTDRIPAIYEVFLAEGRDPASLIVWPEGETGERLKERLTRLGDLRRRFLGLELRHASGGTSADEYFAEGENLLTELEGYYPSRTAAKDLADEMARQARGLSAQGEYPGALKLLTRAYELDPASGRAASSIAGMMLQTGDLEGAERWARLALDRKPANYVAMAMLGKVMRARGDFAGEESWLRRALDIYPEEYGYRLLLGRSLFNQGKLGPAAEVLEGVLVRQPENSDALFFLGLVRFQGGDPAGAEQLFQKALRLDPRHPSRREMEEMLVQIGRSRGTGGEEGRGPGGGPLR